MSASTSVTVVIPHYGDPAPTRHLVDQLRQEQVGQIIISDDCSPTAFPETDGATVIRRNANGGFGAAVNSGAAAAEGSLLLILNSDLEISTDFVDQLIAAAAPFQPAVVAPRVVKPSGDVDTTARSWPTILNQTVEWLTPLARWRHTPWVGRLLGRNDDALTATDPIEVDWLVGAAFMVPTAEFRAVGGIDERYFMNSEEIDLQRRLAERGIPRVYVPGVTVVHEGGGSSDPQKRRRWLVRSQLRYAQKWGGLRRLKAALTAASLVNFAWNLTRALRGVRVQPARTLRHELSLIWGDMTQPRILLLSPAFHGYWKSITNGFRQHGLDIDAHTYDANTSLVKKVTHKLVRELPERLGVRSPSDRNARHTAEAAAAIRAKKPDITIIIRGDQFGDEVHDALDEVGSKKFVWLWDEVRRTNHTDASLDRYDHLISYSPLDTAAFNEAGRQCLYIPNAFDPSMTPAPRHTNEVVFIGARYPRRDELLSHVASAGVPVRAYGREWSRHPYDRARTWRIARPPVPAARDIPRLEGYALTAGAPAAINIHSDQDGFTMKTFEAPGVGGVQLIDREDVSEHYDPGTEVAVFRSADELADLCHRAITDDRWGDSLRRAGQKRTLAEHTWAHRAAKVATLWA